MRSSQTRILFPVLSLIVLAVMLGGCSTSSSDESEEDDTAALASISVSPDMPRVMCGETQQFTAEGIDSEGKSRELADDVQWSSSDTSVATVDETGIAMALKAGTTTIEASYGGKSGSATMTVTELEIPPAEPENVTATAGDGRITLNWDIVPGATSYHVYWSTTSGITKETGTKIIDAQRPYVHSGLAYGTSYYYVVTAVNDRGESGCSNEVSATPASTPPVTPTPTTDAVIIDHACARIDTLPEQWITKAKQDLHIAYGHTSHGSQLITGMTGLCSWKGDLYAFNNTGTGGALDLRDTPFSGASDLGSPDRTSWAGATRTYLNEHADINVVIWSWCGQVSSASEEDIDTYLSLMSNLEADYPHVKFVYMTGHLDGSGLTGDLHLRNEQIRAHCRNNGKILYDFADIESYNPDGEYFGDKIPDDNCDYDSNGDGVRDANWALQWQDQHTLGVDWFSCSAAHSQALNGNLKAYAAWQLWARLAGWGG